MERTHRHTAGGRPSRTLRPDGRRAVARARRILPVALLAVGCAASAPPVSLPELGDIARIEVDPGCTADGCPPIVVVRNVYEIGFKLAFIESLNEKWKQARPWSCPAGRARGRTTFFDTAGALLLTLWERAATSTVQLAYDDPETGCQVTRWVSLRRYARAIEAAQRRYRELHVKGAD